MIEENQIFICGISTIAINVTCLRYEWDYIDKLSTSCELSSYIRLSSWQIIVRFTAMSWLHSRAYSGDDLHDCSTLDNSISLDKLYAANNSGQPMLDMNWVWVYGSCNLRWPKTNC